MSSAAVSPKKRSRGRRPLFIVAIIAVLVALLAGAYFFFLRDDGASEGTLPAGWQIVEVRSGTIDSTVSATGNLEPQMKSDLRFEVTGTFVEVLVKPGDKVAQGAILAKLDDTDLKLQLEQAQADLRQAQAEYEKLLSGASPHEIAEAKTRIAQARSQYQQTANNVSQADIAAARATLAANEARLARLRSGPLASDAATANEQVQRAQNALEQARVSLAAAKERAKNDIELRANALRNAQDEYSKIYWENRKLADDLATIGNELPLENKNREAQALRVVQDAEAAVEQARLAYEQAKKDEISTLELRQVEVKTAMINRDKVMAGSRPEEIADAEAALQQARARVTQITGKARQNELAAQSANIQLAQTSLEKLTAAPDKAAISTREAAIVRAEVAIRQAQRRIEQTVLKAPFAATVARVEMRVGEPTAQTAIIALADLSKFYINVPVDELDVAQVTNGQKVRVVFDALPTAQITGTVINIAPLANRSAQGTTTYEVRVELEKTTANVRPGMTAAVRIVTSVKPNVVLVPRRAVRSQDGQSYVLIPLEDSPPAPGESGELEPANELREVTLGLSNSQDVEIVSGLTAGEKILVQDVVTTMNPGMGG